MTSSPILLYAFYIGAMFVVGFTTAFLFPPDAWYRALEKPSWNPPDWLFGPVWTVLYIFIGVAGAKISQSFLPGGAMGLWWAQWALNGAWTALFFGFHQLGIALIEILILLAVIVTFIFVAWPLSKTAALLFVPYAAWVGFATVLNATIFWMNR
ncbi:MAG: TspO/MBR family protein [Pseudomonadota bacterium]